jgi:YD repeat-containing protein
VTTISANGTQILAYGYDAYGRRSSITRASDGGAATTYGYDGADRIASLVQSLTGGAAVTYTLAYDPNRLRHILDQLLHACGILEVGFL